MAVQNESVVRRMALRLGHGSPPFLSTGRSLRHSASRIAAYRRFHASIEWYWRLFGNRIFVEERFRACEPLQCDTEVTREGQSWSWDWFPTPPGYGRPFDCRVVSEEA
jgi:hypothetical protein